MIEVFDTAAARSALARRKLRCPDCGQALRPWGHARERTIRELGGALATVRPDRALCTGCGVSHVVLDAGLLPRRAWTVTSSLCRSLTASWSVTAPQRSSRQTGTRPSPASLTRRATGPLSWKTH